MHSITSNLVAHSRQDLKSTRLNAFQFHPLLKHMFKEAHMFKCYLEQEFFCVLKPK